MHVKKFSCLFIHSDLLTTKGKDGQQSLTAGDKQNCFESKQILRKAEKGRFFLPILIKVKLLHFRFYPNSGSDPVVQVVATERYIELVFSNSSDDTPRGCVSLHDFVAVDDEVGSAAALGAALVQSSFEDVMGRCLGDVTSGI